MQIAAAANRIDIHWLAVITVFITVGRFTTINALEIGGRFKTTLLDRVLDPVGAHAAQLHHKILAIDAEEFWRPSADALPK
jgi:hypothetical protein